MKAQDDNNCWSGARILPHFPVVADGGKMGLSNAWKHCRLNQKAVDEMLARALKEGLADKTIDLTGGHSEPPSPTGLAAKERLQLRGWTVTTN